MFLTPRGKPYSADSFGVQNKTAFNATKRRARKALRRQQMTLARQQRSPEAAAAIVTQLRADHRLLGKVAQLVSAHARHQATRRPAVRHGAGRQKAARADAPKATAASLEKEYGAGYKGHVEAAYANMQQMGIAQKLTKPWQGSAYMPHCQTTKRDPFVIDPNRR